EECPMTIMSVRLPAGPLTLDDVADLADQDPDHRYELKEGNLLVIPPADDEYAEMIMRIGAWLIAGGYAGRALATPGVKAGTSGRSPDVAVRRSPRSVRTVWIDPADLLLVIELLSRSSPRVQLNLTGTSSLLNTRTLGYATSGVSNATDRPPCICLASG